ncbi:Host cell surface-exposed lipoprotein [compost metagenome]
MKIKFGILLVSAMMLLSACGETATIEKVETSTNTAADVADKSENTSAAKEEEKKEKEKLDAEKKAKEEAEAKAKAEAEEKENSVPREHKAALEKAELYAESMHMSKAGVYEQLTSEYGENFPKEAAQYAIDNIKFDWKESALKKAQLYAETMSMSDSAIYEQLTSEYGEKFTAEEAQYAIDNLE